MVGILLSFLDGLFSGAMLVSGRVGVSKNRVFYSQIIHLFIGFSMK